jgi:hypothetical protein
MAEMSFDLADDRPLFIVAAVRSGTTLTRDLLRRVPNFICPEETHFFRWAEPFRTPHSYHPHRNNVLLRKHRNIDGVDEASFEAILEISRTKAELQRRYIAAFARAKGVTGPYRWFDKTPQNIYGAALIAQQMPHARFLFLVRNPLNVVASMKLGRQVKVSDLYGACNYWIEAAEIFLTLEAACPERVLCVRYEDLVADIPAVMAAILAHARIAPPPGLFYKKDAHPERDLWRSSLTQTDVQVVRDQCAQRCHRFGYDLDAALLETGLPLSGTIANTP